MNPFVVVPIIVGCFFVAQTRYAARVTRRQNRRRLFAMAQERARVTGKPLVVIGDPDAGIVNSRLGRDYGCGDLCVDINGCPKCADQVKAPLETWLPAQATNSAVLFVSAVLEYVDDARPVIEQINRVSGGDVFIVTIEPWTYTAFFYPGAKRRFFSAPPHGNFQWQEVRK